MRIETVYDMYWRGIMKRKTLVFILFGIISLMLLTGCKSSHRKGYADIGNLTLEQLQLPEENEEIAVLYTNYGEIKIRLFEDAAPKAVMNFKELIRNGTYNEKTFFRIRKDDFIISGVPEGSSIWGSEFEDEFSLNHRNLRGAVSMANRGENTNTNGFFIVKRNYLEEDIKDILDEMTEVDGFPKDVIKAYKKLGGLPELDFKHTVLGQVFYGLDVVDKIADTDVDSDFKPLEDIIIEKAELIIYHK